MHKSLNYIYSCQDKKSVHSSITQRSINPIRGKKHKVNRVNYFVIVPKANCKCREIRNYFINPIANMVQKMVMDYFIVKKG